MATTVKPAVNRIRWATPEEGRALFDYQAHKLMGISGEEFLRRWDAGEYREIADAPGHRHIMRLAMLIPFARQDA
jgi:hypothetical protein